MKTFFGMTAAALLVVTMLFVALPGRALAKKIETGAKCNYPIETTSNIPVNKPYCDTAGNFAQDFQAFKCLASHVWASQGNITTVSLPCARKRTCKMIGKKAKCVKPPNASPHTP